VDINQIFPSPDRASESVYSTHTLRLPALPVLLFSRERSCILTNLFLQTAIDLAAGLLAGFGFLVVVVIQAGRRIKAGGASNLPVVTALGGLLGSPGRLIVHGLTDASYWGMVRRAGRLGALGRRHCRGPHAGRIHNPRQN